jgi:hypothetical protein
MDAINVSIPAGISRLIELSRSMDRPLARNVSRRKTNGTAIREGPIGYRV